MRNLESDVAKGQGKVLKSGWMSPAVLPGRSWGWGSTPEAAKLGDSAFRAWCFGDSQTSLIFMNSLPGLLGEYSKAVNGRHVRLEEQASE